MIKKLLAAGIMSVALLSAGAAGAHSPICNCYDNGDGTITCEGGFSDGSSAAGVKMTVKDASGAVLIEGKMSKDSEYSFDKPKVPYTVSFDGGDGHSIEISGDKIVE